MNLNRLTKQAHYLVMELMSGKAVISGISGTDEW